MAADAPTRNPLFGIKSRKIGKSEARRGEHFRNNPPPMPPVPGQRLAYWLGQAAKRTREDAGISMAAIAVEIRRREDTVDRFERGVSMPQDLEKMLAAYAKCAELPDPRDLVADALRLWYEHGTPPSLNGDGPG